MISERDAPTRTSSHEPGDAHGRDWLRRGVTRSTRTGAGGHEVHAVARRRGPGVDGATWHEVDLLAEVEVVERVRPEVLVHLAWYAEHGKFWTSAENVRWVEASLALLRAFAAARGRRVVMTGTCAEYEWSRDVYPESAPLRPATLYGAAKHGLHRIATAFAEQAGLSLSWGRLFFLYGPYEAPERFVPSLVRSLLAGEPAPMTDGEQRRDFLHVADAGSALAALADSDLTGAVNVASGEAVALKRSGPSDRGIEWTRRAAAGRRAPLAAKRASVAHR